MPSAKSCIVLAMIGLAAGGCAQTASFQVTRAPQAYTDGLHRIAVLDFAGPKRHGSAAAAKLRESLAESGRFQVVDEVELQHYACEPLRDTGGQIKRHAVMDAGRQMRLDGLLLGAVALYDTRDEFKMRRGAPQAGATLEYELIELPRGVVRDSNKYRHVGPIALETSRPETALTICTNRAALNLVPHKLDVEVPLARSVWPTGALHAGNSHAAKGEWGEAQEEWQLVLREDPENHTALHNMGVAAEAQGRYAEARQFYRQALDGHQESMYEDALTRVENTLENSRVAEAQRPRRETLVSPASFAPRSPGKRRTPSFRRSAARLRPAMLTLRLGRSVRGKRCFVPPLEALAARLAARRYLRTAPTPNAPGHVGNRPHDDRQHGHVL